MESRRFEEFDTQSPIAPRVRDRRMDLGPEPYLMRRSPQSRRSLSPRQVEVSHKLLGGGNRRSSSVERSDYVWDLGPNRAGRVRSRSPPLGLVQKRPHYDEGVTSRELPPAEVYRRYETSDYDAGTGYKNDYAYKQRGTAKFIREEIDGGRLDVAGHRMLVPKSLVPEDGSSGGVYRLPEDLGPPSKYVEYGGKFSSPPVNLDLGGRFKDERVQYPDPGRFKDERIQYPDPGRFKDERVQYPDPLVLNKFSGMDTCEKGEKHMFHLRDAGYSTAPVSMGTSHQFKDFTSTSPGNSRVNFAGPIRVGMPLPSDEQPRSSGKLQETLTLSGYGQRLDPRHEAELKDLALHRRDTFSPTRAERRDYLYARLEERERDNYGYPSDEIYRRVALPERVDYEYDHKDLRRLNMVDPVAERVHNHEFSRRNPSGSNLWDHPYLEKKTVSNHIPMSRSSAASKQGVQYLDPVSAHIELGREISKEQQIPYSGEPHDHEISHIRLDYGLERDNGLVSRKERTRRSPEFQYETERLALKTHAVKAEALGMYEQSDRMLKRKYAMVEEMERHDPRTILSSKWNNSGRTQDRNPRGEEWIDQDASGLVLSKRLGYDHEINRRAERTFDRANRHRGPASRDGMSFDDPDERLEEHSNKTYKPVGRNIKGHKKPVYLNWHNSYQSDRRHGLPKPNNVWIRGKDDYQVDARAIEVDKSEPPEDSEEFKQLVQKYFLIFTKKLNDNPIVRKRYKEDGRAGSLFCIVCGRSMSKEFMDTKRLVNHAFMSHKVGLKAQHLGLQRAICVLLGWSSVIPTDVVTWTPDIISIPEALSQKEDLIIWPPVILIHNTSLPDHHDPQGESNITIEALEDFLRGKGLSKGKVRFGKPGHHSIMVVKFLGTFSGLQDAEKLQSYFADNKHGRRDFEQIGSSKGKSKEGGKIEGDKVDELSLYGYMGIAEDLDKVDFDTKRKCSIKSKKEIQDLVDAPVKPE